MHIQSMKKPLIAKDNKLSQIQAILLKITNLISAPRGHDIPFVSYLANAQLLF